MLWKRGTDFDDFGMFRKLFGSTLEWIRNQNSQDSINRHDSKLQDVHKWSAFIGFWWFQMHLEACFNVKLIHVDLIWFEKGLESTKCSAPCETISCRFSQSEVQNFCEFCSKKSTPMNRKCRSVSRPLECMLLRRRHQGRRISRPQGRIPNGHLPCLLGKSHRVDPNL